MIAFLLFAAQVSVQPVTAPSPEIVVLARKLQNWKGKAKFSDKGVTCKTTKSTGDRAIDAIGCSSMVACMGPMTSRIMAAQDRKLDEARRKQLTDEINKEMITCLTSDRDKRIAELADRRFEARAGQ